MATNTTAASTLVTSKITTYKPIIATALLAITTKPFYYIFQSHLTWALSTPSDA